MQKKGNYLQFEEAREFVRGLNLKKQKEWRIYCKSGLKPENIPSDPSNVYKDKGWRSYGDWLGTGFISSQLREYLPFEKARDLVRSLNLKNTTEWKKYRKSGLKPENIPTHPDDIYKYNGWVSMGDWIGNGRVADNLREYLKFEEAREFARSLNLKNVKEWKNYCKSGNKPYNISSNPNRTYKNKGWVSFVDWLGINSVKNDTREYLPFEKAMEFILQLKLKNRKEWRIYCKSGLKPNNIPSDPYIIYQNKGWTSWGDFLGYKIGFNGVYLQFEEARNFVRTLNLKNEKEWRIYYKSGIKPNNIPTNPNRIYKDKGWLSWGDWLGTKVGFKSFDGEYMSYQEVLTFVRKLNLKNMREWREYCKSGLKPDNIPAHPDEYYKKR